MVRMEADAILSQQRSVTALAILLAVKRGLLVLCAACLNRGKFRGFRRITSTHTNRAHGYDVAAYRVAFPEVATVSREWSIRAAERAKERLADPDIQEAFELGRRRPGPRPKRGRRAKLTPGIDGEAMEVGITGLRAQIAKLTKKIAAIQGVGASPSAGTAPAPPAGVEA